MPLKNETVAYKQSGITFFSNCAAFFNFLIYLYLAEIIIQAFFPMSDDSTIARLLALSVFSAGYLARPIGGVIFGRLGDIYGRRPIFFLSSCIITVASLITAFLPTYEQVGIVAPILFVVARLIQGMGFGGHTPLGWVVIAEQVKRSKMAFFCSIFTVSFPVTIIVSMLFFDTLFDSYTRRELIDYAWRIPFVVSAVLNLIAMILGLFIQETPVFIQGRERSKLPQQSSQASDLHTPFKRFNAILLSFLLGAFTSSLMFFVMVLLPILIPVSFSVEPEIIKLANGLGIIFLGMGYIFFGLLADRGHVGKALMMGSIAVSLQVFGLFYLMRSSGGDYLLFMYALLGFFSGVAGLGPIIILQLFPTRIRLTALALAFDATFAVVGGLLPFALIYLTGLISFSPALYIIFIGLVGFALGYYIYSTPKFRSLETQT